MLVILSIIVILAVLLVAGGGKIMEKTQSVRCVANLRILQQGVLIYASDHQGELPVDHTSISSGYSWYMGLVNWPNTESAYVPHPGYKKHKPPYFCPANEASVYGWTNYAMNANLNDGGTNMGGVPAGENAAKYLAGRHGRRLNTLKNPQSLALFLDSSSGEGGAWYLESGARYGSSWPNVHAVHGDRVNVVFLDGHVESPKVFPRDINEDGDLNEMKAEWFWPVR